MNTRVMLYSAVDDEVTHYDVDVEAANDVTTMPARLSVFRCGPDGKLDFVRAYGVDAAGKTHYWMTVVGLD